MPGRQQGRVACRFLVRGLTGPCFLSLLGTTRASTCCRFAPWPVTCEAKVNRAAEVLAEGGLSPARNLGSAVPRAGAKVPRGLEPALQSFAQFASEPGLMGRNVLGI